MKKQYYLNNLFEFCKRNGILLTVRFLSIIVFCLFLFGGIDNFIIEKYVENEKQLVNQSFVDSSVKQEFIDKWNRWFCQSSTHIEDIILEDEKFIFCSPKNYIDESNSAYIHIPETDEGMIQEYVVQLTKETTQLGLAIIFPFMVSLLTTFANVAKKLLKKKPCIYVKDFFILVVAVLLSLQTFYYLVGIFVKDWNTSTLTVPIILMIFSLLDFAKKRIFELNDKEK